MFKKNLSNSWAMFFISMVVCGCLLFLERLAGVGWSFHPDALTYVNQSSTYVQNIVASGNPLAYLSHLYYFISYALKSNVAMLIILNVLVFSLTNVIIYVLLKDGVKAPLQLVSLLIILFNPYRVHLAVHVLKDTLVIFFLVLTLVKSRAFVLPLVLTTVRAALYVPAFLPRILNVFLVCGVVISYFVDQHVVEFIYKQSSLDFSFRTADQVPAFAEVEYGLLLRALTWPFMYLTGSFFLTSPTLLMFPLALAQVLSQIAALAIFNRPLFTFGAYLSLGVIAVMTPGFTTFYRYALPIFTILPLLLVTYEKK